MIREFKSTQWLKVKACLLLLLRLLIALLKAGAKLNMPFKQDWFGKVVLVENNYQWQLADSTVLVKLWKENGIHMTFKGLALSRYYLNPTHCEFGDFDCYLSGKFEDGNRVASDADYKVDTGWYKHFHIRFSRGG